MAERRTKIVATLGPASRDLEILKALVEAGVNVFRINCSHSNAESIRRDVANIRRMARTMDRHLGILLDLQGPKIRTGSMREPLQLKPGDVLEVVMDEELLGVDRRCGTTYTSMSRDVREGDRVLFDDGAMSGVVAAVHRDLTPAEVHIRMEEGGILKSHKGINLPGVRISMPSLTEKDIADLEVGVLAGVDFVALSFVRQAAEVLRLRAELARLGEADVPIIAKIEKPEALENIQEILAAADGIMVARGDLGVEVPLESVPIHQKRLIDAANRVGAIVITATQMLDSMERNPRPTRAETTDVANAILDGTDAVMLSGETANGLYPVRAVKVMDRIAQEVERSPFFRPPTREPLPLVAGPAAMVARAAAILVSEVPRPLIVFTWSGQSAIAASKARPRGRLFALTATSRGCDRLTLVWGVTPVKVPVVQSTDELIAIGERALLDRGLLEPGQEVVVLAGSTPMKGATNTLKVYAIGT